MKKIFIKSLILLIGGIIVGNHLYQKINPNLLSVFNENEKYYCLQYGVFQNKEAMQSEIRDISPKLVIEKDNKYYVYLTITGNKENAEKLKMYFENDGVTSYLKEIKIESEEFKNNVREFDILIENTNLKNEVYTIEEVVLSNYEKNLEN